MPYANEELVEPFWADYAAQASGRDPLAIQNSSVVIYTKMMVGITNVTNRIRYNGFYCWLLEMIVKNIPKRNSLDEQIRYIRRAELLLAYVMVKEYPDVTGVSGSAYAAKHISQNINLRNGADWDTKKEGASGLYWQFKAGVFGQYYSGVVRELNLINHPTGDLNIYTVTTVGKELAAAFGKNIPDEAGMLFWNGVFTGSVATAELSDLKMFALHLIPVNSDEIHFYETMLLGNDDKKIEPTFHRQQTLKLLLQFLNRQQTGIENLTLSFLKDNYNFHINLAELENNTATCWYLFEINELLHVAFEHFHACFLYTIKTHPTPVQDCIESLVMETETAAIDENIDTKAHTLRGLTEEIASTGSKVYEYYDLMESTFKEGSYGHCLLHSIQTILGVYNDCKKHLYQLTGFAQLPEYYFNRHGYAIDLIEDLIASKLDLTLADYINSVLLMAINLHTFSSYSKTKIGQNLVHNYLIEDNLVWRLRETEPNRTTPRLQNAVQYITDIGWLKREDRKVTITNSGVNKIIG
jgi:hypothetical protein